MDVINRINEIMKKQGMTRYQLAKASGLSQSTLSNMYSRNTIPSVPTIQNICDALNISLSQFFADENDEFLPVDVKQREVLDLYLLLEPEQQDAIITLMKTMRPGK